MFSFSLLTGISFDALQGDLQKIMEQKPLMADSKPALRNIFSFLDFTSLDGSDNHAKIRKLCEKAISFGEKGLPYPAAVCIYPPFIATAKQALLGTPIKVATTAAAFPHGQMPISVKLEEIRYAIHEGADEVDVVISRGTFLEKDYHIVFRELDAMRDVAGKQTLKVILETGELVTMEHVARASEIAIEAGADFIKTSTGKISPAATEQAVYTMLLVIREYYRTSGKKIGIKPAGGISEPEKALNYYWLVNQVLGKEWLTPSLFRIGASRLAERIIESIL
ncbi:MAG: deoxyribose-phosphate aldolase [Bacteroidota bacterium]